MAGRPPKKVESGEYHHPQLVPVTTPKPPKREDKPGTVYVPHLTMQGNVRMHRITLAPAPWSDHG